MILSPRIMECLQIEHMRPVSQDCSSYIGTTVRGAQCSADKGAESHVLIYNPTPMGIDTLPKSELLANLESEEAGYVIGEYATTLRKRR